MNIKDAVLGCQTHCSYHIKQQEARKEKKDLIASSCSFVYLFPKITLFLVCQNQSGKEIWMVSFSPLSVQLLLPCRLSPVPCTDWLSTIEYIFSYISVFYSQIILTKKLKCKGISTSVNLNTCHIQIWKLSTSLLVLLPWTFG